MSLIQPIPASRFNQGDLVRHRKLGNFRVERVERANATYTHWHLHLTPVSGGRGIVMADRDRSLSPAPTFEAASAAWPAHA